jgi:hypothetical protein
MVAANLSMHQISPFPNGRFTYTHISSQQMQYPTSVYNTMPTSVPASLPPAPANPYASFGQELYAQHQANAKVNLLSSVKPGE